MKPEVLPCQILKYSDKTYNGVIACQMSKGKFSPKTWLIDCDKLQFVYLWCTEETIMIGLYDRAEPK